MKSFFISSVLACALAGGCARFGKTVPIAVFDGDTGQPLAGATVSVTYGSMVYGVDLFPPHDDAKTTMADGVAKVKVCRTDTLLDAMAWASRRAIIGVTAAGYISYAAYPRDHVPPTFQRRTVNGKDVYAVPVYKIPAPQIVIVLPDGYRGSVRVTRRFADMWVQDEPGKRVFEFPASAQGDVEIEAGPLLYRMNDWSSMEGRDASQSGFRLRYAGGQEIPRTSGSTFSFIQFRNMMTQPTLPPGVPDSPQGRAWFERRRLATTRSWVPPRPPEFGVDFIASDEGNPEREPPQKRSLFAVGGEQEVLRVREIIFPPPIPQFSQTRPTFSKTDRAFERAWNLR